MQNVRKLYGKTIIVAEPRTVCSSERHCNRALSHDERRLSLTFCSFILSSLFFRLFIRLNSLSKEISAFVINRFFPTKPARLCARQPGNSQINFIHLSFFFVIYYSPSWDYLSVNKFIYMSILVFVVILLSQ